MTETPPEIPVVAARRSLWDRVSIIWLVPIAALAVALGVAWQNFSNQGPLIEISFADASGITARETQLRFRDVGVGLVEGMHFSPELDQVVVEVRLSSAVVDYVDSDATFWVVRPRVTAQGISGLETVLSGVYIKGQWDTVPGGLNRRFEGLEEAPLLSPDEQGTTVILRTTEGGLTGNVPLLYKGVEVGRVGNAAVTDDGFAVEAMAVVLSPWDGLLTQATRFYNVSGFSLRFGANGASIDFESAATLLVGGVSFETWVSGAPPARPGDAFVLYPDSEVARSSVFNRIDGPPLYLSAVFEGNVTGLAIGAAVEIDGLRIGEVAGMTGIVDPVRFGDGRARLLTQILVQPVRLGFEGDDGPDRAIAFLQDQVAQGLRARLVTASILNGALKVQMTVFPDIPPGTMDLAADPYPAIPVAPSEIADIQATAQDTLDRINALPIEELLSSAASFLDGASTLVSSPETQALPQDIRDVIASIQAVTASDEVQAVPAQVQQVLAALDATLQQARDLIEELNQADAANRLMSTVDSIGAATDEARIAIADLPDLVAGLQDFVDQARALNLPGLATEAEGLLADARALVASDGVQAIPGQVSQTVDEVQALLAEVRESGVVADTAATVADIRSAVADIAAATGDVPGLVDQAGRVLTSVEDATAGLPDLISQAGDVADALARADLPGLAVRAGDLVTAIADFVATDDVQALPGGINDLVANVDGIAADLRAAGVADSLNAAIASVQDAAAQVASATDGLPDVVTRANQVLDAGASALAGLSDLGQTMRDVRTALREISRAADAVASLATRLERSPNSLIFGN